MTISAAIDLFLADRELRGCTQKTIFGYKMFLDMFASYCGGLGIMDCSLLDVGVVNGYQLYLLRKKNGNNGVSGLSRSTVRTYVRHVKVFLTYCFESGLIISNISLLVRLPRPDKRAIEILSDGAIKIIMENLDDGSAFALRNRIIILLMLDCGLRMMEVVGLKREDVHVTDSYLMVLGKGNKTRVVPVGNRVRNLLSDYMSLPMWKDAKHGYFLLHKSGRPITGSVVKSLCFRLKRGTGIKKLHPHLFRHTFATNYLLGGFGDVYELSRILGHSEVRTTERYLHIASYYEVIRRRGRDSYFDRLESGKGAEKND
ncbi:MAG: tyrosine-type recombinase/integrase [Syntrophomonadaceae bacterium]|nr:tyrosine-type recombinase/integrase [Syntrophomonadaceae bacterium]